MKFKKIIKKIISIINFVLIFLIIINLFNFIIMRLQKNEYISFLDYSYWIVEKEDISLKLKPGDFLLIDLKAHGNKEDYIFYYDESMSIGKVKDIGTTNIKVISSEEEKEIKKDAVKGTVIKVIPSIGNILNLILKPICLIIMGIILLLTSIIQSLLTKKIQMSKSIKKF